MHAPTFRCLQMKHCRRHLLWIGGGKVKTQGKVCKPRGRNLIDILKRLQESEVGKHHLGHPEATDDVCPSVVRGLLEGSSKVGAETTGNRLAR